MELIIGGLLVLLGVWAGIVIPAMVKKHEKKAEASAVSEGDEAVYELAVALRCTVEYIGNDLLPAQEGWAWYDALRKYEPAIAQYFVDNPVRFTEGAREALKEGDV
jgi:hypothetical protein